MPPDFNLPNAASDLIEQISRTDSVGIHPSYASNADRNRLSREIDRLQNITQRSVRHARQHFLKIKLPDTYRALLAAGIRFDYSMGYAADLGFRAGTALPFSWFDLDSNRVTELTLCPFQVMDVTLRHYLAVSPAEATVLCDDLVAQVKSTGGAFCTLWHNSSFAPDWRTPEDWTTFYFDLLRRIQSEPNIVN